MGKRNQYNRSTLPVTLSSTVSGSLSGSFDGLVVQSSFALNQPTASFTVSPGVNGYLVYPNASTYTGSIDIGSMKNGQRLEITSIASGFLLSSSNPSTGKFFVGGAAVNTASVADNSYSVWFFVASSSVGTNLLVRSYTGSIP